MHLAGDADHGVVLGLVLAIMLCVGTGCDLDATLAGPRQKGSALPHPVDSVSHLSRLAGRCSELGHRAGHSATGGAVPSANVNRNIVSRPGTGTWVALWTGEDAAIATHDCGEATETVIVNPTISTEAMFPEIEVGDASADHVTLGGRKSTAFTGTVTVEMFGPFESHEQAVCTGNPSWVYISDIRGDEDYSSSVTPSTYGWYTFQATFEGDEGTYVQDECGAAKEWVMVHPTLSSQVSAAKVTVGEQVDDTINLRGVPADQTGLLTWQLFGPFDSAAAM